MRFGVSDERARVVGSGIDEHPDVDADRFRAETGVTRPYALYLGRLDPSKGVPELAPTICSTALRGPRAPISSWSVTERSNFLRVTGSMRPGSRPSS